MPVEPNDRDPELAELTTRLAALEAGRRARSPFLDHFVRRLGEAELAVGTLLLVFTPFDALSLTLSIIGGGTWAHETFIRQRREMRAETERRRQIDLLRSELDRVRRSG